MKINSAEFKPALARDEREASMNPMQIDELSKWQRDKLSTADALGWLQSLPMEARTNQPAAVLAAEYQVELKDWHGLQAAIQPQNWNELEYLRHALVARSLREQGLTEASTAEWGVALKIAGDPHNSLQKSSLTSLCQLAAEWQWNSEAEQILWIVVNRYPEGKWCASCPWTEALMRWHRTRSLAQLFNIMLGNKDS